MILILTNSSLQFPGRFIRTFFFSLWLMIFTNSWYNFYIQRAKFIFIFVYLFIFTIYFRWRFGMFLYTFTSKLFQCLDIVIVIHRVVDANKGWGPRQPPWVLQMQRPMQTPHQATATISPVSNAKYSQTGTRASHQKKER